MGNLELLPGLYEEFNWIKNLNKQEQVYFAATILAKKYSFNVKITEILKSAKICQWDFPSSSWLITWAHE